VKWHHERKRRLEISISDMGKRNENNRANIDIVKRNQQHHLAAKEMKKNNILQRIEKKKKMATKAWRIKRQQIIK